ncbi:MAG: TetR/AcrR family transcriptional regulator [Ktedonobacteraceae bacterium]|nr:TetR/AcrR family transcriptional regulator [Ktedonobacteraceae bacterium]
MSSKRDQIILATRDLVFEQGLQDVAMSQIAQRALVGMGTIYNYFPSKEDLVFCLFSEIKAAMSRHVLEGYDVTQPVVDRVLYLLGGMVRYGIEHPREFLLMDQLALVPFIHERAKSDVPALVAALKQVLIDATQQHLLKAMPPGVILALISGAMDALVEAHMRQQIHLDQATIEQAMLACWDAIKR